MNAGPMLARIAAALHRVRLEAVMIDNAAAALQGAPVTTLDIDFMFRKTPANLKKLKMLAKALDAYILRPFYPASGLYRVVNDDTGMQLDFMSIVQGIDSFESLRADATPVEFDGCQIQVAGLPKIIQSKRALGRLKDSAVIEILEKTLDEKEKAGQQTTG